MRFELISLKFWLHLLNSYYLWGLEVWGSSGLSGLSTNSGKPFYGAGYRWWRKAKVHDSRTLYIWWTFHAVSVKLRDRIILLWCKTIYSNSWRLSINHLEIRLWNEKLLFCSIIYYRANNTVVCSIFIKTYDPIPLQTLRRLVLREIAPNLQKLLVLLLPRGLFS